MARVVPPKDRDGFEIAIICALQSEADAVEALFDQYWDEDGDRYGKAPGDTNTYTTGAVGCHNVVLAHMPGMGKGSAASVASIFRASFGRIKLALVVGICGGVPFLVDGEEILLGDVIISTGIIQYDFGRQLPDRFVRKDTLEDNLGRPNTEIRGFLSKLSGLRSRKRLGQNAFHFLQKLCKETDFEKAQYPGPIEDRLYERSYRHKHHELPSCTICTRCEKKGDNVCETALGSLCSDLKCHDDKLVQRQRLPASSDAAEAAGAQKPRIHFGLIASGDMVMKSGEDRDEIALTEKVIGFEMEGAAVWDNFPCVVIKGVCDYADSHKNKNWQGYAAAAAAACMKAFLKEWVPAMNPSASSIFQGLQDPLSLLPFARNAPFNSYHRQHEPTCLPDTRVDLLQEIYNWANGKDERCIFWLNGLAGTGKSTIARTVARRYSEQKRLGASFFFSRGGGDVGHAGKFFTSFAVQLARHIPQIQRFISDAITEQDDIASQSLHDQWRKLVFRPLSRLDGSSPLPSYVLIVDALDECDNEDHIRIILQLLAEARLLQVRLRVLITSKPEVPIRYGFCLIPNAERRDFILHDIKTAIVDHDIFIFLLHEMRSIAQEWALGTGWPGEQALKQLVVNASGLFIWAATACRFIRDGREYAERRLSLMLQSSASATAPERHLNEIYITVLENSIGRSYDEFEREDTIERLRKVLGSIIVLSSPLSASSISRLLHVTKQIIDQTLNHLHSILHIPEDRTCSLRLHHPSFRDFLLDNNRCNDPNFWVDEKQAHRTLADDCIRLMSISLKRDVCEQKAPGTLVADVASSRIEQCLAPEVRYACLYWIQHLQKSGAQLCDEDQVHQFLQIHLLHWLETLGWIGKISEGILAILSLEAQIPANKHPNLYAFVHDAKRFALYNRSVIEEAPLQLYCSALVFAPENSIVRRQFKDIPPWIQRKPKVRANWSAALQTLEGHSNSVNSVAFSPDGKQVMSGSEDKTVRLWDAETGAALQTLKGHSESVDLVAFSPDSKNVVSGSHGIVQFWDVEKGAVLQTLEGHWSRFHPVALSPDHNQVVSGSEDGTVRLWDVKTGAVLKTLESHLGWVTSVAFSPDGKQVVYASHGIVQFWDLETEAVLKILGGLSNCVNSVAFSPDGKQVVSGSDDGTVRLWDVKTGAVLKTLNGYYSDWIWSVAFSPDGKRVVSGSYKTMQLWDIETGAVTQTLEGHSDSVISVAFSPDSKQVVSGSEDGTVRLWDVETRAVLQTPCGHSDWVTSVAFSPDGKQVVSGSKDRTVRLWDARTEKVLKILGGHSNCINSVAFSPDGKQIVSGSEDRTVRLWDVKTGTALMTLGGNCSDWIWSVAFSPDGKRVVSGSEDKTVRLWNVETGKLLRTLKTHSDRVILVAFSPDGKQVLSGSHGIVQLWDVKTGAVLQTLEGHSSWAEPVAFLADGKQVESGSSDRTVRLWDVETRDVLQTLEGHSNSAISVAFLPNGKAQRPLFVENDWVVERGTNVLWLPPDCRETCQAVWNKVIVLGHSSGIISILELKEGSRLI